MALNPQQQRLGRILVEQGLIDATQLHSALASAEQWGRRLPFAVVELRMADEATVVRTLAASLKVPFADLTRASPSATLIARLDTATCEQCGVIPIEEQDGGRTIVLGMVDPTDLATIDLVQHRTRARVRGMMVGEAQLLKAIRRWYRGEDVSLEPDTDEAPVADLDELKLVDVNGQTLMVDGAVVNVREELDRALAAKRAPPPAPPPPARPAPPPAAAATSGRVLPPQPPPAAAATSGRIPPPQPPPSAAATSGRVPPPQPPPAPAADPNQTIARLQHELLTLRQAHEQSALWMRAVLEVLVEKRLATPDELHARVARMQKKA